MGETTDIGRHETPRPNVAAADKLLKGIRAAAPQLKVLHIDNANPAVIAAYPDEAAEVTQLITRYCTDGNTAALGLPAAEFSVTEFAACCFVSEHSGKSSRSID